jgi:two-component system OmpR family sensor kinase
MNSIRARLLAWLCAALAAGSALVIAITYVLARQQIGDLYDDELRQVAYAIHLREDWTEQRLRIARAGFALSVRAYDASGKTYFETAQPSFPSDAPQVKEEGFLRAETSDGVWRIYTHVAPEGIVQVGQARAERDAMARSLSAKVVLPLLLLIPLLVGLVAWVLTRALRPIDTTSRMVSDRDANRLDALPTGDVPQELQPLIGQINGLLARLSLSLEGQRRFLADIAHELRSPVSVLAIQAQLGRRAVDARQRTSAFEELEAGVERVRRLVQQLLDFARLDPSMPAEAPVPVDLAKIARGVVASCAAYAEQRGIDVGADAPVAVGVLGREQELQSLVTNLLDNALRYAPAGSAVTVAVQRRGGEAVLRVMDRGPGIPIHERPNVFARFYRVRGDSTPGSGLGLAICKAIAERHGASIQLEDAFPGQDPPGLVVIVQLPLADVVEKVVRQALESRPFRVSSS